MKSIRSVQKPQIAYAFNDEHKTRYLLVFCAIACFFSILRFPIFYYHVLRLIVSTGAFVVIVVLLQKRIYVWLPVFLTILILFNPLYPIYLYRKAIWVPIDIITGILFLLIAFFKKNKSALPAKPGEIPVASKVLARDRMVSSTMKR
ncbi:DUF6804 family protein [Pedobacter sp. AW1-32]|uniref:DUF6804 family protein n=1 Tax=Pedobacter sp. AW1-32 TaxID=3383026 RepID=UPI003FEE38EF